MGSSFDWSQLITLAEALETRGDEASLRCALSRAYYYVYHLARLRAFSNNYKPVEGGLHAQLWRFYKASPDLDCRSLGVLGERLSEKRQRADYDQEFGRIAEEVPAALKDAKVFSTKLNLLPGRFPNQTSVRR